MKNIVIIVVLVLIPLILPAQTLQWLDVSSTYELPEGVKLFHGTKDNDNSFFAYYYEVDLNVPGIAVRPYMKASVMQVNDFAEDVGAFGAINGGFFGGSTSVSSVIYPGTVAARNITALSRTVNNVTKTYPVIRPVFAINTDRTAATEWMYHHSVDFNDIYVYDRPLDYTCDDPDPLPSPLKSNGVKNEDIAYGLGGGPMLIKDGAIDITYCEEVFWGSGVYLTDFRPRTAVGYTVDNKVIMFVTNSMKIGDVAQTLFDLGCQGAMNLDGGGSTAMSAGAASLYDQGRGVPTILAIVHADSLDIPKTPTFEKFIDTGDAGVSSAGSWFASANDGYYGDKAQLHALATDDEYFNFPLDLPQAGEYEIYGWWTSHANRASDTPFYITHAGGTDKVAVNQTIGGSFWNLIGTYQFDGTQEEKVRITAGATTNQYVVADAVRVVSYEVQQEVNTIALINDVDDITVPFDTPKEDALALLDTTTTIVDSNGTSHRVSLSWTSETYQSDMAGDYTATGSFELPQGVQQTDPETELIVTAIITVLEKDDTAVLNLVHENIKIFPNPGNGIFTLEGKFFEEHLLQITNLEGKVLHEQRLNGLVSQVLNLSSLSKGIYILRLSADNTVSVRKLVIG